MTDRRWLPLYIATATLGMASAPDLTPVADTTPAVAVAPPMVSVAEEQIILVDGSGSMVEQSGGQRKIDRVRQAIRLAHRQLGPSGRLSIVVFDDHARVIARQLGATEPLEPALARLSPMGGTNLHGGMTLASTLVEQARADGFTPKVTLYSDGRPNVGVVDRKALSSMLRDVDVKAIGLGDDFDPDLLRALSHPALRR